MGGDDGTDLDLDNTSLPLTALERQILSMKDEDYHYHTWEDLKEIIASNSLETLKRRPSDLRRYLAWSARVKAEYGGIVSYVIQNRLFWTPRSSEGPPQFNHESDIPFANPRDYAVLKNDWPYGLARGISHLVVWTKTPIQTDELRGDVTIPSRQIIQDFVQRYFVADLENGEERVQWFKNWVSLQSVRGLDHIHVMVKDAPEALIEKWCIRKDL